jgi:hypothetical protein
LPRPLAWKSAQAIMQRTGTKDVGACAMGQNLPLYSLFYYVRSLSLSPLMKPAPLSYKREGGGPFEEGDSEFFLLLLSPLERSSLSLSHSLLLQP